MGERDKAWEQLEREAMELRRRIAELEAVASGHKRVEDRLNMHFAVTRAFAESATIREATPRFLQAICEGMRWELGELWRIDAASNVLRWEGAWHVPDLEVAEFVAASPSIPLPPGRGLPGRVWVAGRPAWISDIQAEPDVLRASIAAKMGLRAALAVPIQAEQQVTGVLLFFSREFRPPDPDALKFMEDVGRRIGHFIERKRAEEALRKSEATARAFLESAAEGVVIVNREGRIVLINAKTEEMFGYRRDELIGQGLEILLPERFRTAHVAHRVAYFAGPRVRPMGLGLDLAGRRKDGSEFPVEISLSYIETEEGVLSMGFITDITARKQAEEALTRQAEELLRLAEEAHVRETFIRNVVESIQDGIIVLDRQGRITEWNRAMEERYGIPATSVRGKLLLEAFPTLAARGFEEILARVLGGEEGVVVEGFEHETRHRGRVTMNIKGSPIRTPAGEVSGVVLALEDVTERLQLEVIARQSEKMAAVGTLAAGIAHEINNPIGIISSRVELMLLEGQEKALPPSIAQDLKVIGKHADRVARITRGLLSFSRQAPWRLTAVDVNQVVEEALLLVEKQLAKEQITLRKDLAPDLPKIQGSPNHLEQVLVNLLTNAREAMPHGGTLRVSTAVHRAPLADDCQGEDQIGHRSSGIGRPWVEIRISDTGQGIPAELLPRIFDPFFTTKEQGTGLGLSISYGIVREHGGTITVDSRPGEGSAFTIRLPIQSRPRTGDAIHDPGADPHHRR